MAYYATYMPDETGELQRVVINAGVGFCLPFYGTEAPPGALACDGSEISREAYKELFAVLGTKAGAGDGVSTFNLPDFRGEFIRGWDAGRGVDAGRELGSYQPGTKVTGESGQSTQYYDVQSPFNIAQVYGDPPYEGTGQFNSGVCTLSTSTIIDAPPAAYWCTVRPRNVALLWCIIYE